MGLITWICVNCKEIKESFPTSPQNCGCGTNKGKWEDIVRLIKERDKLKDSYCFISDCNQLLQDDNNQLKEKLDIVNKEMKKLQESLFQKNLINVV